MLLVRITLFFGRRVGRLLLYPICSYFLLFSPAANRASRKYLARVLERRPRWRDLFRHYHCFASTLLDRIFLFSGRHHELHVVKHGGELFEDLRARHQGAILLGAHLGSFDVANVFGREGLGIPINMMMYENNAKKFKQVQQSFGADNFVQVIPIGSIDTLLKAKARIDEAEMVAILGDRVVDSDKLVRVPFFGAEAVFPAGPFLMASALKVPVLLFFGLYLGGNHYEGCCEVFADRIELTRGNRQQDLERWVRRYAERLEYYCRLAPYNWFNFYDFWDAAEAAKHESDPGATGITTSIPNTGQ